MRNILLIIPMLFCCGFAMAQDVIDDFNVGPYEVYYKGQGDVNFRLKKGVNLYEYFGLKKDTIIQVAEPKPEPLKRGVELCFFGETGMSRTARNSMVYGLEGVWKQRIANKTYANGGLSLGYALASIANIKEDVMEIGIPLSIELTDLNTKKATLYGSIGVSPTYYTTMSTEYTDAQKGASSPEKYNGLYVAPRLELGGYIPVGKQIVKVGVNWRYKINCSTKDADIYKNILGRVFVGAHIGVIF